MASEVKAVEYRAELRQVKSMADHTYNVILNFPEDALTQVQQLMGWVGDEISGVMVNETQEPQNREKTGNARKRRKG